MIKKRQSYKSRLDCIIFTYIIVFKKFTLLGLFKRTLRHRFKIDNKIIDSYTPKCMQKCFLKNWRKKSIKSDEECSKYMYTKQNLVNIPVKESR